jgi:multidrug transporter EmrE-like cation transporter
LIYIYLILAIGFEVMGTMLLSVSQNFTKPMPTFGLIISYLLAFYFLTFPMKNLPIAIVYATWSGLGVFLISILSYFIYNQVLQWQSIIGLCLIVAGVILVNTFTSHNIH